VPVYKDSIDTIIGTIHEKDFFNAYLRGKKGIDGIMQNAFYTTEHAKISVLLRQLQKNKVHIAVVLDEYGGTLGMVTLEDILEEFNIKLSSKDIINKKLDEIVKPNDEIIITRVKEEVDTQVLEIPCEVEYIEDASLLEGQTKEHIKGENGKLEIKYRITYKNGVPIKKQKISEVILIEPIKQIVKKGILKADTI
jgi:Mg2+/Co2+ transporter CorB